MAETSTHNGAENTGFVSGEMPIESQSGTFSSFMSISRYAGSAIALLVFWSTIFFGMRGDTWATALSTIGLGLLLAAALKLRGAFIPLMVISFLILGVLGIWLQAWRDVDLVETAQAMHTIFA
jgi:hypothetical protein